jgi:hypothetical protein
MARPPVRYYPESRLSISFVAIPKSQPFFGNIEKRPAVLKKGPNRRDSKSLDLDLSRH